MATKTQKEFNKQMKQFEKEGKLPAGYYGRRKGFVYGSGLSIFAILFLLWRFGVFHMIFGTVQMMIFGMSGVPAEEMELYRQESEYAAEYSELAEHVDAVTIDVYQAVYKLFFSGGNVTQETLADYRKQVEELAERTDADKSYTEPLSANLKDALSLSLDMIDFADGNFEEELNANDRTYFENMAVQSRKLAESRERMLNDLKNFTN